MSGPTNAKNAPTYVLYGLFLVFFLLQGLEMRVTRKRYEKTLKEYNVLKAQYDRIEAQYPILKAQYDTQCVPLKAQYDRLETEYSQMTALCKGDLRTRTKSKQATELPQP